MGGRAKQNMPRIHPISLMKSEFKGNYVRRISGTSLGSADVEDKDDKKTDDREADGQGHLLVPGRGQGIGLGNDQDIPMTIDHGLKGFFPGPYFSEGPQHKAGQNRKGEIMIPF